MKAEFNLADLKTSDASQRDIEKQQAKVRNFATDFTKARGDYNRRYPSDKLVSNAVENVLDDEEPEIFDERQYIKSIIKQNEALRSRILADKYISENQEKSLEERKAAKKRMERNQATFEKNEEEKKRLLEHLGIKKSCLGKRKRGPPKRKRRSCHVD